MKRREFLWTTAAAAAGSAIPVQLEGAPYVHVRAARPVVIASGNGNRFRNGGTQTAVERAFARLMEGADPLDAVIAGVNINELDAEDYSVGYGGLPNADGVVQLDASCMHGPTKRAGAVAALEGVRTPSLVAKAVLENTDHILLVADGAQRFARQLGFEIEDDLNTENSRRFWLEWKRRTDPQHWPDPRARQEVGMRVLRDMIDEGVLDEVHAYGTINCDAVDAQGRVAGVTTTSGLAWKIPGRVGDSPMIGAGLYVDNDVGAAGSTGRGEANLYSLTSFLIVEEMRRGRAPLDACMEGLGRIVAQTPARLRDRDGRPAFGIEFYALNKRGEHAGATLWSGRQGGRTYAVCDEGGARSAPLEALFEGVWTS